MATHPAALSARPLRRILALVVALAAVSSFSLDTARPAQADINADIRAAQAQLTTSREQTEAVTEKFNAAQLKLAKAKAAQSSAESAVAKAKARAEASHGALAAYAASAYRNGGMGLVTALVNGDPQTFLDRSASLELLSRQQAAVIREVRLVAHDQAQAEAVARDAAKEAQKIIDALATQRAAITAGITRQQTLLSSLVARQQQLVAAARDAATRAAAQARATALASEARAATVANAAFANNSTSSGYTPSSNGSGGISTALEWARREMGKPYVYGAAGPDSFDCSGLTQYVFGKGGIALDHYTGSQWNSGRHVDRGELQPGDLVFFYSDMHHVGIYVGNGQMIDAPHSGASVRQEAVWWGDYVGAVRVTG